MKLPTLTIDGQKIADITIPSSFKGSDVNGFYNVEYAIPASLAKGKTKFVVRLTASSSTLCPGIYYVRLMKDYNAEANAYQFRCTDWTTGDSNRVQASKFSYDTENNTLTVNAGTGANNVALMMKWQELDYDISKDQIYLVIRGTNLKTTSGASYLWWLNGTNRGSQVPPASVETTTLDGVSQQVIAFNMATSGLYDNFTQERNSLCMGQTIFGLTSTTGTSTIHDINFVANVDDYMDVVTGINTPKELPANSSKYTLDGRKAASRNANTGNRIVISNGRKQVW